MEKPVFDLKKRTYLYGLDIIRFLQGIPRDYISRVLAGQLLRSGTSVGANTIEAQAASSRKDFANFYQYALKSANETKFWLNLLKDSGIANPDKAQVLLSEGNEIANILAASIIKLKKK
jgi:four helix bundle protein